MQIFYSLDVYFSVCRSGSYRILGVETVGARINRNVIFGNRCRNIIIEADSSCNQ